MAKHSDNANGIPWTLKIAAAFIAIALAWSYWPILLGFVAIFLLLKLIPLQNIFIKLLIALVIVVIAVFIQFWWSDVTDTESVNQPSRQTVTPTTMPLTQEGLVTRVIDGDTIEVQLNGNEAKIRLIGIDAPELEHDGDAEECFAIEAKEYLTTLLLSKTVRLESDPTQANTDVYDRLLRYVYLESTNVNEELVRNGFAYEYSYNELYTARSTFMSVEKNARDNAIGLWSPDTCNGKRTTVQPENQPTSELTNPDCDCSANLYDCSDFTSSDEAQACFDYCGGVSNDVHKLDGNDDGVVCSD